MLLASSKKNHKKLREVLNQLYGHLDNSGLSNIEVSRSGLSLDIRLLECFVSVLDDMY